MKLDARTAALALASLFAVGCAAPSSEEEPAGESTGTTQQAYTGLTGTSGGPGYVGTCPKGSDPECVGVDWNTPVVSGGQVGYCSVDLSKSAYSFWGACTWEPLYCSGLTGCRTGIGK